MTSGAKGDWVRQGTPHDDNTDWNQEQSDYGTALSPAEWDDYSSEQSVPVAAPRAQASEGAPTTSSPDVGDQPDPEPVPGQEPDSEEEYRSDETEVSTEEDPAGDPDDSGMDPVHIDAPEQRSATAVDPQESETVTNRSSMDEQDAETTRPRPVVPDASTSATDAAGPESEFSGGHDAMSDGSADDAPEDADETHVEAAEYLAVDPVPVDSAMDQPDGEHTSSSAPEAGSSAGREEEGESAADAPAAEADGYVTSDETRAHNVENDDESEATQAVPVAVVSSDAETTGAVPDGLYRADGAEHTAVISEDTYPEVDVEEERQQARLDAERQAREQRLGAVATSPENASREDAGPKRVTTDKFLPSFSLFVLRLVTASILGVISWQILGSGVDATANYLAAFPLIPEPRLVAWILGFLLGALALLLVVGLLQRLVGFLLLVVAVATLTFIRWGTDFSIFSQEAAGFIGDRDLLLAAIGLLLLGIGGGRWGIDGAFRASRAASKAERDG